MLSKYAEKAISPYLGKKKSIDNWSWMKKDMFQHLFSQLYFIDVNTLDSLIFVGYKFSWVNGNQKCSLKLQIF